jgi:adenylate cyclase
MPIEIERKFLVVGDEWRGAAHRAVRMRQGYLGGDTGRASVRVRVHSDVGHLNIKAAVIGSARAEYEYEIPQVEANEMLDSLCVGRIEKTRYYVTFAGHTWEVDEFDGDNAGLIVAELELSRVDEAFEQPSWLGIEVTNDQRYYNHALALKPFTRWRQPTPPLLSGGVS